MLVLPRFPSVFQIKQHLTNKLLTKLGLVPWSMTWCIPSKEPLPIAGDDDLFGILNGYDVHEEGRRAAHMRSVLGTIREQLQDPEESEQEQGARHCSWRAAFFPGRVVASTRFSTALGAERSRRGSEQSSR